MNIVIWPVPQLTRRPPKKSVPMEMFQISQNIKTPDCYRERIEDVTTQLASIKTLFMNKILRGTNF